MFQNDCPNTGIWSEILCRVRTWHLIYALFAWPLLQQVNRLAISPESVDLVHCIAAAAKYPFSKRFLAAAIHKKINIYEIASASSTPVKQSLMSLHV